jgi:hypothetical protein
VYQNQIQYNDAYVAARGVFARADLFPRVSSVHSLVGLWVVVMLRVGTPIVYCTFDLERQLLN